MMDPDFLKRRDDGMTTQAPTPPWTVKRTSIYGANGALVFVAAPMTTDADSQLAAAAPELLAALKHLLGFDCVTNVWDEGPGMEGWQSDELLRAFADCQMAISKAEGKL